MNVNGIVDYARNFMLYQATLAFGDDIRILHELANPSDAVTLAWYPHKELHVLMHNDRTATICYTMTEEQFIKVEQALADVKTYNIDGLMEAVNSNASFVGELYELMRIWKEQE